MSEAEKSSAVGVQQFSLVGELEAPEVFAEGWTHFYLGYPVTKIRFHTMLEPPGDQSKEVRRVVATLSLPTTVAVQLAQTILAGVKSNEHLLTQAADQAASQLRQLLSTQNEIPSPQALIKKEP